MTLGPQRRPFLLALTLWDLAWRVAAVRVALRRYEYKWAIALGIICSAGIVPMAYLARTRLQRDPAAE